MKAAKLMRRPVVAATPRASVRDIAMQLVANGFSGMPVTPMPDVMKVLQDYHILRVPVTDRGKLVGIISRIDLIRTVLEPEFMAF